MIYLWSISVFVGVLVGLAILLTMAERLLINYGICQIDINAGERSADVDGGQTLLSALMGEEIFIPSACGGRGSCGYCKIIVVEGGGQVLPTETPYLKRKEVRSGVRLACQVKIRQDIKVKIPEDLLNVRMFDATLESSVTMTHDIKQIRIKLAEGDEISQRPGQYVQIQAPSPDGPVFRAYSISSPSYAHDMVELIVRLVPDGIGSTYLHNLQTGDPVIFTGPYGEFELNQDPEVPVVCVGGGCGMAPMRNIIHTIYDLWPERECWLFFGCRGTGDVFLLEEFEELAKKHPNFHVVYALSDAVESGETWNGETGFIHLAVDKYIEENSEQQAFLCGPPLMIEAATRVLLDKGLAPDNIFYDEF